MKHLRYFGRDVWHTTARRWREKKKEQGGGGGKNIGTGKITDTKRERVLRIQLCRDKSRLGREIRGKTHWKCFGIAVIKRKTGRGLLTNHCEE